MHPASSFSFIRSACGSSFDGFLGLGAGFPAPDFSFSSADLTVR